MAITYLCYYMEKGDRVELKSINVQNNSFGKVGQRALQGLRSTFPKLVIEGIWWSTHFLPIFMNIIIIKNGRALMFNIKCFKAFSSLS